MPVRDRVKSGTFNLNKIMTFGVQFNGSLAPGQIGRWFTHSWNASWNVAWVMVPTGPAIDGPAQVEWKVQSTRQAANLVKWFIEVRNVTNVPVTFEARYAIMS